MGGNFWAAVMMWGLVLGVCGGLAVAFEFIPSCGSGQVMVRGIWHPVCVQQ